MHVSFGRTPPGFGRIRRICKTETKSESTLDQPCSGDDRLMSIRKDTAGSIAPAVSINTTSLRIAHSSTPPHNYVFSQVRYNLVEIIHVHDRTLLKTGPCSRPPKTDCPMNSGWRTALSYCKDTSTTSGAPVSASVFSLTHCVRHRRLLLLV